MDAADTNVTALPGIAGLPEFEADLAVELARARRYERPLSLCVLELTGYDELDESRRPAILALVAGFISEVRSSDAAYFLGGERFAIILPETAAPAAELVVGRIAMRVATSSLDVGLRWGIAPALAPHAAALISGAESALYAAKDAGSAAA